MPRFQKAPQIQAKIRPVRDSATDGRDFLHPRATILLAGPLLRNIFSILIVEGFDLIKMSNEGMDSKFGSKELFRKSNENLYNIRHQNKVIWI